MIVLSKNQIIKLHSQLIQETGGTDGIRDEGLLESVLAAQTIIHPYNRRLLVLDMVL